MNHYVLYSILTSKLYLPTPNLPLSTQLYLTHSVPDATYPCAVRWCDKDKHQELWETQFESGIGYDLTEILSLY
ncbi:hypothetical protein T07_15258 [Trichinella nelsoni]|uniref:Uncharacterized protein n=1 Tax=Trichinella nelsoni TaxID=6336 RepID=A0A0V0REQ2_9BILA|nr:hypothetical protein T07_15258 [Trichinella nelsoni]